MVQGARVIDKIYDAREVKELAKEAKKVRVLTLLDTPYCSDSQHQRVKQGLAPAKIIPRNQTPSMPPPRSQPSTSGMRKREAPTPTPHHSNPKRQRTGPTSTVRAVSKSSRTTRTPATDQRDPGSSPTPLCGIPRLASGPSRVLSGQSTSSSFSSSDRTHLTAISWAAKPLLGLTGLAKDEGRKPRRESFKPRPSVVPGLMAARANVKSDWGLVEEEEGMGDGDVF